MTSCNGPGTRLLIVLDNPARTKLARACTQNVERGLRGISFACCLKNGNKRIAMPNVRREIIENNLQKSRLSSLLCMKCVLQIITHEESRIAKYCKEELHNPAN